MKTNKFLFIISTLIVSVISAAQTPAGSNLQIQFNDNNSFGASPYLRWDGTKLRLDDLGATSAKLYFSSESGDHSYIFSENWGSNKNRLVIETQDDGDDDYTVFRNKHYNHGNLDVFEIHRSYTLARGSRNWSESTQGLNKGTIHLDPENTNDNYGSAITFGASDSGSGGTAQAGVYVRTDGSYGSKMYFSTTNSYANGAKTAMMLDHTGRVGIGTSNPSHKLTVQNGQLFFANSTANKYESGRIRFSEYQASYQGAFVHYDGSQNALNIGVHDSNNTDLSSDVNAISIKRNSAYVGIGTSNPLEKLHVQGKVVIGSEPTPRFNNSLSGYVIQSSHFYGHTNSQTIYFGETNNSVSVRGKLGIGTTTPTEKLEVNGTIRSQEVKVEASPWPDYVFEPNYKLRSLEETEKFIQAEKHLPEVPSSADVEENGIALGEMNALLLKKIEELTLHVIEIGKQNSQLIETVEEQSKRIENLEKK